MDPSPVDTQETVKAQPVQSTEALVAAVAAPAPYPLATLSDIFYCLWVISFVFAIGYLRYVARGVKNQSVRNSARRQRGPRR